MPITPRQDESQDDFISRCIRIEIDNGKSQPQAVAICIKKAEDEFRGETASVSDNTWSTEAPINVNFAKVKKILFDEDFNEDDVKKYKDLGFKILVRSKRKLKKKDKKVWNKLKSVGLTEDVMLYGEVKELHKKYNFHMLMTGQDPILEHLSVMGQDYSTRRTIKEFTVNSMEEAKELELKEINNVEMKFITVRAVYFYRERPDVAPATKSGSRPFCSKLMSDRNRGYSLLEIQSLPTEHLVDMGLPPDAFLYRGGFYTLPGGVRGVDTTPFCRHEWKLEIITV
jgi:hypothetical protein